MSQAVVALLAAVVGAAAAIAGQSLVPILTARKAHETWLRDKRAELCEQFITAFTQGYNDVGMYAATLDRLVRTPNPAEEPQAQETRSRILAGQREHIAHLWGTASRLRIYGPIDVVLDMNRAANAFSLYAGGVLHRDMSSAEDRVQLDRQLGELHEAEQELYRSVQAALGVARNGA